MRHTLTLATALAGLGLGALASGDTIYVPDDEPTIQEAINAAAQSGDEIIVAPDVYPETIDLLGKAVIVRSSDGAATTIIDGAGLNNSVVTCENGEGLDTVLEGFTIRGGTGTEDGSSIKGGGLLSKYSDPLISHCIFRDNSAEFGGAVYNHISSPRFRNCSFHDNTADDGAGVYNYSSNPIITNSTFTRNIAAAGGGMYNSGASPRLINCIIYGNTPNSYQGSGVNIITYSDIAGGAVGMGNIDADPMFVDDESGDLRLSPGSPCIDAGDSDSIAVDIWVDLNDEPRGVDDPDTENTGIPVFALTVDIGAYEFQVDPGDTCPGDINGDNKVDTVDLLMLLGNWGICP